MLVFSPPPNITWIGCAFFLVEKGFLKVDHNFSSSSFPFTIFTLKVISTLIFVEVCSSKMQSRLEGDEGMFENPNCTDFVEVPSTFGHRKANKIMAGI